MYRVAKPSITKVKSGSNGSFSYHHDGRGLSSIIFTLYHQARKSRLFYCRCPTRWRGLGVPATFPSTNQLMPRPAILTLTFGVTVPSFPRLDDMARTARELSNAFMNSSDAISDSPVIDTKIIW